ncbi:hypothetical protein [Reichenbachiella sp.]|uniref:hypothetical protein n=1 Tax=Reichenbachiella sp. TaxID=2184521 RepID=UPI003BAF6341
MDSQLYLKMKSEMDAFFAPWQEASQSLANHLIIPFFLIALGIMLFRHWKEYGKLGINYVELGRMSLIAFLTYTYNTWMSKVIDFHDHLLISSYSFFK